MNATNRRTREQVEFQTNDVETAAARLGRRLRVRMIRVTGDRGLSGIFRGYRPMRDGGLNSHGDEWHIG